MTTERRRQANQQNARRSTGPKTSAGKAQSKQNAWKHGLSVAVSVQPHFADLIRDLETGLHGESEHAPPGEDVHAVAVAAVEVLRARSIRSMMIEQLAKHCSDLTLAGASASKDDLADLMQHLLRADRYERRALSRRKSAIRSFSEPVQGLV